MKPRFISTVSAIVRKDLLVELRTLESVPAMALFAVSTLVIFHFAFDRDTLTGSLASGVLWVTLLFAATVGINRIFVAELEQSRFDGLLLAPISRTALFLAKGVALFLYLVALEVVAIPAFVIFFLTEPVGPVLPQLIAVVLLTNVGLAAVGCFASALTVRARARELLLPVLLLPLMVPLLIAASNASASLFLNGAVLETKWLLVIALFDTVLLLLSFAVFDFLLEE